MILAMLSFNLDHPGILEKLSLHQSQGYAPAQPLMLLVHQSWQLIHLRPLPRQVWFLNVG
jgi:hypothetical protein